LLGGSAYAFVTGRRSVASQQRQEHLPAAKIDRAPSA
jgi:hypothetical protein